MNNYREFVLHASEVKGWRFFSDHAFELLEVVKCRYARMNVGKGVKVYGVTSKNLTDFTTSKKDIATGINRVPFEAFRLPHDEYVRKARVEEEISEEAKDEQP